MPSFTIGPWHVAKDYVYATLPSGYTRPITTVYSKKAGSPGIEPDCPEEEAFANARLIATAPQLLRCLQGCIGYLQALPTSHRPDPIWFAPALAAIAQATEQ